MWVPFATPGRAVLIMPLLVFVLLPLVQTTAALVGPEETVTAPNLAFSIPDIFEELSVIERTHTALSRQVPCTMRTLRRPNISERRGVRVGIAATQCNLFLADVEAR